MGCHGHCSEWQCFHDVSTCPRTPWAWHPRPWYHSLHIRIRIKNNKRQKNVTSVSPTFVTHLECSMQGDHYPADQLHNLSKAGKPLLVRYDLERLAASVTKSQLAARPEGMWR